MPLLESPRAVQNSELKILAIDVGGSHIKALVTGETQHRKFDSGPTLTAEEMAVGVRQMVEGWNYDVASIGYPGPVHGGKPALEPQNLGNGWVDFDYAAALGCPVRMINDAAMQALGSYEGGKMLFLGLGTGLGSTMIVADQILPMELGDMPYRKRTFEEYVGRMGLKRLGRKRWRYCVFDVIERLTAALQPEYIVLGGGNVELLKTLPPNCRPGDNANAFKGGFRLWQGETLASIMPAKLATS